jgi:hypothetical protein
VKVNVGGGSHVADDGEEYTSGGKWIEMVVEGDHVHIVCVLVPDFYLSDHLAIGPRGLISLSLTENSFLLTTQQHHRRQLVAHGFWLLQNLYTGTSADIRRLPPRAKHRRVKIQTWTKQILRRKPSDQRGELGQLWQGVDDGNQ